ncbi:methyl-accepting chemotaxis protein [Massilia sp. METH4]|uniref:methyl-accepting chemotaxis protein n=1 Tax=Massilia sp. METH4 TaxID=3123041 RepID=UPI0030CE4C1B
MKHWTIGQRLALAFGVVLLVMAGISLFALSRLAGLNDKIVLVVNDRYTKVQTVTGARVKVKNSSASLRTLLAITDPERARHEREEIAANDAEASRRLADFESRITSPKAREGMKKMHAAKRQYEADRDRYLDLLARGEREAATALLLGSLSGSLVAYEAQLTGMVDLGGVLMMKSVDEAEESYRHSRLLIAALSVAGLALAATLGYWISQGIAVPVRRAVSVAETIAAGNLAGDIRSDRRDETGQLIQALGTMNTALAGIVAGVRANADAIAGAASEIASGTMDLSSRTEEQASSLEETASSMEELTSAVRQSADTAHSAMTVAQRAAVVAEKGGAEVGQVMDRMAAISEASRRIADITGVIDGIAFQTNILALNAAVEAARAGEQGRGFAVVASEVRNLAHRSATAAKEIKALIEDSSAKVAAGSEYAHQAGKTMEDVLAGIRQVATLMHDIDSASHEQTVGIEQINGAITQMDHVTQQNAALVEEAAAAAEAMRHRTDELLASVSVFVLDARGR